MRRSWRSLPLETGAGFGAESLHAQPHITPCPLLAAGLRGFLPAPRRLRGPLRQSPGVTAPKKTAICSQCGHRCRGRYDTRTCRARDHLSAGGFRIYVQFERVRVHCPRCRSVFVERLDWLATNPRFTQRFAMPVGAICREMTNTAGRVEEKAGRKRRRVGKGVRKGVGSLFNEIRAGEGDATGQAASRSSRVGQLRRAKTLAPA